MKGERETGRALLILTHLAVNSQAGGLDEKSSTAAKNLLFIS